MNIQGIPGGVCAAKGFKAGGIHSGIKPGSEKPDLAMILCETQCSTAAVYTQNKVKGAPILLTQQNIQNGYARGILVNSGNANTCNPDGMEIAQKCCNLAAQATGLDAADFIIASTGVIGQALPLEPFERGIPQLTSQLSAEGSGAAARAIMTTDTVPKEFAVEFTLSGKACRLGGIGKGSGMINPNMATMLVFVTTDAAIEPALLQQALSEVTAVTFNQICIDGDTSTNDTLAVLASGLAGNPVITERNEDYTMFCAALRDVCTKISRALAADGEGATKLLECVVSNARTEETALAIAKTVIASDLFKAAMFGADANWGRVLCAIGYTPGDFSADHVSLSLKSKAGEVLVCKESAYHPYSEEDASRVLAEKEIQVLIDMHDGSKSGTAWGCDLTYDYVKINGDYRS
ncbi:bifunctional glutamate N-acetyltransferase/amino-acid acetyltransferase ArgJ [Christensenellaceae bacterium OttesenSCG-928-K19]|nr:bifunctional glutamate N-acetyltransferase/amino-acid acetyltransferase ArgJ [Christensenellaceae bacterium OttesenSCG-928-K19]